MHTESYDYINGLSLGTVSLSQLSFGDLIQNQHCVKPVVIRFIADPTDSTGISNMRLFLENKGPWKDTEFSYYQSSSFSRIESGSSVFSPFTEAPNASAITTDSSVSLLWDGASSNYLWLDANIKLSLGMIQANFRLFYDSP